MVRLTEVQRGQAIALLMQGQRQQQVARHFGVHVSTIERLVRRVRETERVADRPRSGRPRVTSQPQDRAIRLAHLRNRHLTTTETAVNTVGSHIRRIHPKNVRNRLREFCLRARRPPLAFITALILLYMEFTSALIFLIGMFSHSSSNAVRNCPRVLRV